SDPGLITRVQLAGAKLKRALKNIASPKIGNVRGLGLMVGAELISADGSPDGATAGKIIKRGLRDGLILLGGSPHGNVLSFTPPYAISDEEIAFAALKLQEYLTSLPGSIS
ncbi:MAG TPA: aminotransferase class III-fold pyridoxal phosphate-dependent enzyme, partial [Chthoniobacteraceae bacterium]|nr:aminotransferase class III-fold pyridoxal phosphate-dependent enzyme [Chthoniobacteraceae bacterium]